MKIWIVGGTSEAARLISEVDRRNIIVTVAGEEGLEFLPKDVSVCVGRLDRSAMRRLIEKEKIIAVADMTHPFATLVSKEAKAAAEAAAIPYYRYARKIEEKAGDYRFCDYEACIDFVEAHTGTFFFTTGSKHSDRFEAVKGKSRHIYRVIPSEKSLRILREASVEMKDIVAMLGPFDYEFNRLLFSWANADFLVTKNSGSGSGFLEKIEAARDLGMTSLVISKAKEEGYTYEEMKDRVERINDEIFLSLLHQ